jgi:hypothetical protein
MYEGFWQQRIHTHDLYIGQDLEIILFLFMSPIGINYLELTLSQNIYILLGLIVTCESFHNYFYAFKGTVSRDGFGIS